MAESCKYCESELSPMDGVYIQSELHMSPQKIQNLIEHNQNMVCYNCFKRLKSIRVLDPEKDLKIIKNTIKYKKKLCEKISQITIKDKRLNFLMDKKNPFFGNWRHRDECISQIFFIQGCIAGCFHTRIHTKITYSAYRTNLNFSMFIASMSSYNPEIIIKLI